MAKEDTPHETIPGEHELTETLKVDVYYPDHQERTASPQFERARRHLIDELDTPCFICGSKENREAHHFIVEWAYSEAVDWDKMRLFYPNFDWANFKEPEDFVSAESSLMILCHEHHLSPDHGIHALPYPIWQLQKFKRDDFKMFGSQSDPVGPATSMVKPRMGFWASLKLHVLAFVHAFLECI